MTCRDVVFPLDKSGSIVKDSEVVRQNILQILYTMPGERIFHPTFGIGIQQYLWEGIPTVIEAVQEPLRDQIQKWEPRADTLRTEARCSNTSVFLQITAKYNNIPLEEIVIEADEKIKG